MNEVAHDIVDSLSRDRSVDALLATALGFSYPHLRELTARSTVDLTAHPSGRSPKANAAVLLPIMNALSMRELRRAVREASRLIPAGGLFTLFCLDPDEFPDHLWPGELGDNGHRFRPWRQVIELTRLFPLNMRTPRSVDNLPVLRIDLVIGSMDDRHGSDESHDPSSDTECSTSAEQRPDETHPRNELSERYGAATNYRRFDRLEEPEILDDTLYALAAMRPRSARRVLSIGVNDGRELELFREVGAGSVELWGIDWSESGIRSCRERFPEHAERMLQHDIERLGELDLPTFDIVLALNTLHCTTLDRDKTLKQLGRVVTAETQWLITVPNCHFGADDIRRRPLDRNHARHDRRKALKDVQYLTRYFHRAGYRNISTFGTYDLFLLVRP